jgi:hypothetical protein
MTNHAIRPSSTIVVSEEDVVEGVVMSAAGVLIFLIHVSAAQMFLLLGVVKILSLLIMTSRQMELLMT